MNQFFPSVDKVVFFIPSMNSLSSQPLLIVSTIFPLYLRDFHTALTFHFLSFILSSLLALFSRGYASLCLAVLVGPSVRP